MNTWSNILISGNDPEIIRINEFETGLGKLNHNVHKIRELITRFEVCHFKYQRHVKKIKEAIINPESNIVVDNIGKNHIRYGEKAWEKDTTGKSLSGQQYIWAIKNWLDDIHSKEVQYKYNKRLWQKVQKWLGEKNVDKIRLVKLLLARLTWDWKSYEDLQQGGEFKELEFQICRMDICHYAFPSNLERLLRGTGDMKAIENFEGCGSFDNNIKEFIEKELLDLYDLFKSFYTNKSDKKNQIKAWLTVCLIKTLKEQVKLSKPQIKI